MDLGSLNDEGHNATWVITHGANAAWQYALSVQSAVDDLEAARTAEDWPLCVESCSMALRAISLCRRLTNGFAGQLVDAEFELFLAVSEDSAAAALRSLPSGVGAGRSEAETAIALVEREDALIRGELPFEVPVSRTPEGARRSMRISATLVKWGRERGLQDLGWRQDGL